MSHKRPADEWALQIQLEKEEARVAELLNTNAELRSRCAYLEEAVRLASARAREPAANGGGVTDAELRELIFQFHPDRNPGGLDPAAVTRELIRLRDRVRA